MSKTFDVNAVHAQAASLRDAFVGRRFMHYKGGYYVVVGFDVDEATGDMRVSYRNERLRESSEPEYIWSRTYVNFFGTVHDNRGRPTLRFKMIAMEGV